MKFRQASVQLHSSVQGRFASKHLQRWLVHPVLHLQFSYSLRALDASSNLVETGCQRLLLISQANPSGGGIFRWFSKATPPLAWYPALLKWCRSTS